MTKNSVASEIISQLNVVFFNEYNEYENIQIHMQVR